VGEPKKRYPLHWPENWKRTPSSARQSPRWHATREKSYTTGEPGQQKTTYYRQKSDLSITDAIARLTVEMRRIGIREDDWLISSNVPTRLDGLPYSNARTPDDPGVAVYFRFKKQDSVLACDAWRTVAGNIAAIAAHLEATRAIDRYKVGTLEQMFLGYQALPAKGQTWRSSLGFKPDDVVSEETINVAFRTKARTAHPDVPGGSHDAMASLTAAHREAMDWLKSQRATG
jgi:hypothetical protein